MIVPHLLWPPVLTDLLADGNRRRSVFTIAPLLTPRGPSQTKRSGAFPRPRPLLFFLLRSACLLSFRPFLPLRCHFLNFVSPNAGRRMFFFSSKPSSCFRPRDCLTSRYCLHGGRKNRNTFIWIYRMPLVLDESLVAAAALHTSPPEPGNSK